MRIFFLSINYWPEQAGIGPVNTWRCEYLAAQGHNVTMCTSFPYYPEWRVAGAYRGRLFPRLFQRETHNGVKILRSWMWVPRTPSAAKRILFEASFLATTLFRAMLTLRKQDVLYIVSPPLGLAITARLLSVFWQVPYVFDVMDLQPDAAADLGMLKEGRLVRFLYALERMAYRGATMVTTLTEGMRRKIVSKGIDESKVKLFPARADERLFNLRSTTDGGSFRQHFGLTGKFLVVHSGNMGVKQGLDVILDAARLTANNPEIAYLIVGDGAARADLQRKAAELALTNVQFLPLLPPDQFREMLAAADVALITQQKTVSDIVFPSKTVTLLAAGCPVIASVNSESEIARVIAASGAGTVVAPEDPGALANEILALRSDPATRSRMTYAGTQYARKHWEGSKILPYIEDELLRVAQIAKPHPELRVQPAHGTDPTA